MLIVQSLPWAIVVMTIGLVCLGTWTACWNAIERRGRLPSHTFIDYSLAYMAVAVITSFVGGQLGPSVVDGRPNFVQQLQHLDDHWPLVAFAAGGGACLALGDIAMQYAVAFLGLAVGPPMLNALTIIIGVVLTFFLDSGLNKPWLVFPGMACAALAIVLGAAAHLSHTKQRKNSPSADSSLSPVVQGWQCSGVQLVETHVASRDMQQRAAECDVAESGSSVHQQQHQQSHQGQLCQVSGVPSTKGSDIVNNSTSQLNASSKQALQVPSGSADVCIVLHDTKEELLVQRSVALADTSLWLGLFIALAGGAVYSLFLPAFQIAANDDFSMLPPGTPPLSIYTTNFFFSLAFTTLSIIINVAFLYHPPLGTARSCITNWARDNSGLRGLSILSGVLAAIGDGAQFMGGQAVGYAAAMMVMAYPVVGVLWGVLRFREFAAPTMSARVLLWGQVAFYAAAVGLLAGSANVRAS